LPVTAPDVLIAAVVTLFAVTWLMKSVYVRVVVDAFEVG
jgi:hypothetical protein